MNKISYKILIMVFAGFFWSGCLEAFLGPELADVVCGGIASCLNGVGKSKALTSDSDDDVECICDCDPGFCGSRCQTVKKCPDEQSLDEYSCDCKTGDISALSGRTSRIRFENTSVSEKTYDILLDGEWLSSVAPGDKTELLEVSAGKHHLEFRISGSTTSGCINEEIDLQPGQHKRFVCDT